MKRQFSQGDTQMAKMHLKRCSTSLIIREMQIKIPVRYYLTLIRMVTIKRTKDNKYLPRCKEIGTLVRCWRECKMAEPLWKTVRSFHKKLKIKLLYTQQSHSWVYIQKNPKQDLKEIFTHVLQIIHCSIIHNDQEVEATQISIDR